MGMRTSEKAAYNQQIVVSWEKVLIKLEAGATIENSEQEGLD